MRPADCYEAKKGFANALCSAEAARYLFVSYCKNCLRDYQASVAKRIAELNSKAAGATAPSKN